MTTALDRLTAERVMGWEWCEKLLCWCPRHAGATLNDTRPRSWSPSTDIAAAWEVVEHLKLKYREGRCAISVARTAAGNPDYTYDCDVLERIYDSNGWSTDKHHFTANARTAPLAICLAALAACGVSDEEVRAAIGENT